MHEIHFIKESGNVIDVRKGFRTIQEAVDYLMTFGYHPVTCFVPADKRFKPTVFGNGEITANII